MYKLYIKHSYSHHLLADLIVDIVGARAPRLRLYSRIDVEDMSLNTLALTPEKSVSLSAFSWALADLLLLELMVYAQAAIRLMLYTQE